MLVLDRPIELARINGLYEIFSPGWISHPKVDSKVNEGQNLQMPIELNGVRAKQLFRCKTGFLLRPSASAGGSRKMLQRKRRKSHRKAKKLN